MRFPCIFSILPILMFMADPASGRSGDTINWTGNCDDLCDPMPCNITHWRCDTDCNPLNWSTGSCPGPNDTATIGSGFSVISNVTPKSVGTLTCDGALEMRTDLSILNSASLNDTLFGGIPNTAPEIVAGGTITLRGDCAAAGADFLGAGGFIVEDGTFTILSDPSGNRFSSPLTNNATVLMADAGYPVTGPSTIINNDTWITNHNDIGSEPDFASGLFVNHGTLQTSQSTGTSQDAFVVIPLDNNGGTILADAPPSDSDLVIARGGVHSSGQYQLANGGTIELAGFENDFGEPDGVEIIGPMTASGEGNLKFTFDITTIEAGGSLNATLSDGGDENIRGVWFDSFAVIQCDGLFINNGKLTWDVGRITGGAGLFNQAGGEIFTDGVGPELASMLLNNGTVQQDGEFALLDNGHVQNANTWRLIDGSIVDDGDDTIFENFAVLRRDAESPNDLSFLEPFYRQTTTGLIDVEVGELRLNGGGEISGGSWMIAEAAKLNLNGGMYTFGALGASPGGGTNVSGAGHFLVNNESIFEVLPGHTVTINMPSGGATPPFSLGSQGNGSDDAILGGEGTVINAGSMDWNAGTLGIGDPFLISTFLNLGTMDVINNTASQRIMGGSFTNDTNGTIFAGSFQMNEALLHNNGEMILSGGVIQDISPFTESIIFNNETLEKEGAGSQTISATFDNTGTVSVFEGTLNFAGDVVQLTDDGCLEGGTWEVAKDATLNFLFEDTTITKLVGPTVVQLEHGANFPAIEELAENEGELVVCGPFDGPGIFIDPPTLSFGNIKHIETKSGGELIIGGTVSNAILGEMQQSGLVINLNANGENEFGGFVADAIENAGAIIPGRDEPGVFSLTGDLIQFDTGVIEIELGGLIPLEEHDQVIVEGDVTLDGTLEVSLLPGYAAEGGETFTILTTSDSGGMITGEFDEVCCDGEFTLQYNPDSVVLTLLTPPEPTGDLDGDGDVDGADLGALLGAWGACNGSPALRAGCIGDLNGDNTVNGEDLGLLLGNWSG